MTTKKTILSENESNIIETLLAHYGSIVTFEQIYLELGKKISRPSIRNFVNKLTKNGWLVRIKKGIYAIASIDSRGFLALPVYKIAQILDDNSYVSFEAALQYHGMFDQLFNTVISVSTKKRQAVTLQGITYKFIKTKGDLFFGWEDKRVENYLVKIATPEKALLDMLSFHRNTYSIDLVLEKLMEYRHDFNNELFNKFIQKQSLTVKRIMGFLFDLASIDSSSLYDLVGHKKTSSIMTAESKTFNAKWRLYHED